MKHRILASLALTLSLRAPGSAQEIDPDARGIDDQCKHAVAEQRLVGISVAVARDGKVLLEAGYGKRSIPGDDTVNAETRFAIGSVTKQFTSACVLLLAQDGKLAVDDPVSKYYPDLTRAKDITLLDLMTHVSGYPDYYPLDFVDARMRESIEPDELIARYAGGPLDFEPRTRWSYSNTGYVILGRIVEKVTGRPFAEFLRARLLGPLGMRHTCYEPESGELDLAAGHVTFALGPFEPCMPEGRGWVGAAGAIWSTAGDIVRWDLALMSGKVLDPASLDLMTRVRVLEDGKRTGYGCGLSIGLRDGREVWSHNGAVDGFIASNTMVPSRGVAVVVLSNLGVGAAAGTLSDRILGRILTEPASSSPAVPKVVGPPVGDAVKDQFSRLQSGDLERSAFTPDFDAWLDADRAAGAQKRLQPFGAPRLVEVLRIGERGGMEVSTTRLTFVTGSLRVSMYRRTDGRIAQFFVLPD